jgi:hypothetical protein
VKNAKKYLLKELKEAVSEYHKGSLTLGVCSDDERK